MNRNLLGGWAPLLVLAGLPLLVLALDPSWAGSPAFLDPYIYIGYYLDLPGHLLAFPDHYISTRLPVLLPGWLLHSALPPVAASLLLRFGLYYLSVFSLFASLAAAGSRRAALLAAVLLGSNFFFLGAIGTDYTDGYAIAYLALAQALLQTAARAQRPRPYLAGAGAVVAAVVFSNVFFGFFVALLGLEFLIANTAGRRHRLPRCLAWLAAGFIVMTVALALGNLALGGRFWFFLPSATASVELARTHEAFRHRPWAWLGGAAWLVLPAGVLLGGLLAAWARRREAPAAWLSLAPLAVGVLGLLALERLNLGVVRFWYYATPLLPFALFAVGRLLGGVCEPLSARAFAAAIALALLAGLAQAALPAQQQGLLPGLAAFFVPVGLAVAALLVLARPRRPGLAVPAFVLLLSASGVGAKCTFRYEAPWPQVPREIYDRIRTHDRERTDLLRTVAGVVRSLGELGSPVGVHFWYHYDEPQGLVYREVACTSFLRTVGESFPDPGALVDPGRTAGGLRVAVLSPRPDAAAQAEKTFADLGLRGRRRLTRAIHHHRIRFTLTVYDVYR